jgi:hypothetical protein
MNQPTTIRTPNPAIYSAQPAQRFAGQPPITDAATETPINNPEDTFVTNPETTGAPQSSETSTTPNKTKFGACDPCSMTCSCISTIATAGALALAGLGLIKLGPGMLSKLKNLKTAVKPEDMAKIRTIFQDIPQLSGFKGTNGKQAALPSAFKP